MIHTPPCVSPTEENNDWLYPVVWWRVATVPAGGVRGWTLLFLQSLISTLCTESLICSAAPAFVRFLKRKNQRVQIIKLPMIVLNNCMHTDVGTVVFEGVSVAAITVGEIDNYEIHYQPSGPSCLLAFSVCPLLTCTNDTTRHHNSPWEHTLQWSLRRIHCLIFG